MRIDRQTGTLVEARFVPSPNFDTRPEGVAVDVLVIHAISLPPGEFPGTHIEQLFCNSLDTGCHPFFQEIDGLTVSSHLLIRRNGEIIQFVSFDNRAWHAGVSSLEGRSRVNDFSIGIELEGSDYHPFEEAQYRALIDVIRTLRAAYPAITPDRIVGHSDIAPGRKTDPGPYFNWVRVRQALATNPIA